jgi:hypothetical protein
MAKWLYEKAGETIGPVSNKQLRKLVEAGELLPDDRVTQEGANKWTTASRIKGLFDGLPTPPPPPETPPEAPQPRRDKSQRSAATPPPETPTPADRSAKTAKTKKKKRRPAQPASDQAERPERRDRPQTPDAPAPSTEYFTYDDPADALAAMAAGVHVGPIDDDEEEINEPPAFLLDGDDGNVVGEVEDYDDSGDTDTDHPAIGDEDVVEAELDEPPPQPRPRKPPRKR